MNFKFLLVGVILITLGTTLVVTSYFKIYDTVEKVVPTAGVLPIQANSSSSFWFNFFMGPLPQSQKVSVLVAESQHLQDVLNSTLNYNSTIEYGKNITITLFGLRQNQNLSASVTTLYSQTYWGCVAFHTFDVPVSWNNWVSTVSITNPESYPVCWIVNVMLYGQVVNSNWLTVFYVGMIPVILGVIIVGVAVYKRKPDVTKKLS